MSLARDGRLDATERARLDAHLATCADCSRASALLSGAQALFQAQRPAQPPMGLAARAAAAALAAADQAARAGSRAESKGVWSWLAEGLRVLVPGAAAVAMAAAAFVVFAPAPSTSNAQAQDADPAAVLMTHEATRDEVADALADEVES